MEITEQAQTSLEEELAVERVRREQAERERDELRSLLEASSEPGKLSDRVSEAVDRDDLPLGAEPPVERPESEEDAFYGTSRQEAEDSLQRRPSWWRRFFGLE